MKKIILFDMDGTLTPARKAMTARVSYYLGKLQDNGYDVGIVTGSDMDYIEQQCGVLFDVSSADWEKIKYFPCNGTKYYTVKNRKFVVEYEHDMKKTLGVKKFQSLIRDIVDKHSNLFLLEGGEKIPMSGTFIKYRGSMLNWCPIGRDASLSDREEWIKLDKKYCLREGILQAFKKSVDSYEGITFKLGGDTSFDIYPIGWDKTMAYKQMIKEGYEKIYFVGDRCKQDGNDYEIYTAAFPHGMQTSGPDQTVDIIKNILGYENE